MTATTAGSHLPSTLARRNLVAGAIGSILEWYDFAVYGYLAPIIGTLFFPADDPVASLLAAFGVFAIGFAARPVGGAILASAGARLGGRRRFMSPGRRRGARPSASASMPTLAASAESRPRPPW